MKRYLFFLIVLLSFCFNWNRVEAKSKTSREEKGCTGLDHNRFRYYDSNSGTYISKAPIGLAGNNPNLYAYTHESNTAVDSLGLNECGISGKKVEGIAYRYDMPDRVSSTWTPHQWNVAANHRYTKPGVGGVYAGMSQQTAYKEITSYVPLGDRVLVTKEFSLENVLDLTDPNVRNKLNVSLDDIIAPSGNYDVTHKLGDFAKSNGFDGILAPSAQDIGGNNIIIFNGL